MMKLRCGIVTHRRFQSTSSPIVNDSLSPRHNLSNDQIRLHRLRIFDIEHKRQMELIRRIEKIEVDVHDPIESKKTVDEQTFIYTISLCKTFIICFS